MVYKKTLNLLPFCLLYLIIGLFILTTKINAQDAFFNSFQNNSSAFNPSLVGQNGILSLFASYKKQWTGYGAAAFNSGNIRLEEGVQCSMFDYGLFFGFDEEGAGLLRTNDLGVRFAGKVPFTVGKYLNNLRIGGGFQWSNKSIDYTRLIFSDQLHPKYGLMGQDGSFNLTEFSANNDGFSNWYFAPSIGISHRILYSDISKPIHQLNYGISVHSAIAVGKGHEESLLHIGTKLPMRLGVFGNYELPIWEHKEHFLTVRPQLLAEWQSQLFYYSAGAYLSWSRLLRLGASVHSTRFPVNGSNSSWMNMELSFMVPVEKNYQALDLSFCYSVGINGVRNHAHGMFEVSIAYFINENPSCNLLDKKDQTSAGKDPKCEVPPKNRIYENVWYKK